MARVPWGEGKVISIETRDSVFVLAQMLKSPYLMVFNIFREKNKWDDVDLQCAETLLCCAVTRQFISSSNVTRQKTKPADIDSLPRRWIEGSAGAKKITIWKDTPRAREIVTIGREGGRLIDRDITKAGDQDRKVIMRSISFSDHATIDNHELTDVRVYPEFNERLYLCYAMGCNVDPLKDLLFERPIPPEYERYIELIAPQGG